MNCAFLILFLPLISAVCITLFTQKKPRESAFLSVAAIATSFVLSLILLVTMGAHPVSEEVKLTWLSVGDLHIEFGLRFDALSLLMLLIVTGVGSAIHIYSVGYMHGDRSFSRYFASLSLFT